MVHDILTINGHQQTSMVGAGQAWASMEVIGALRVGLANVGYIAYPAAATLALWIKPSGEHESAATCVRASATFSRSLVCRNPLQITSTSLAELVKISLVLIDVVLCCARKTYCVCGSSDKSGEL